jgi:hypothetical protein
MVGVTAGVQLLGPRTGLGVEQGELRGVTEGDGDRPVRTVDREREIRVQTRHCPARHLPSRGKVNDCDVAGIGHIDEYPARCRVELERPGCAASLISAIFDLFSGSMMANPPLP